MSAEMSGEQMQAKIAAARRDAEGLKDKIKRKKDELADTSCKSCHTFPFCRCSTLSTLLFLSTGADWYDGAQYAEWLKVIPMLFPESA